MARQKLKLRLSPARLHDSGGGVFRRAQQHMSDFMRYGGSEEFFDTGHRSRTKKQFLDHVIVDGGMRALPGMRQRISEVRSIGVSRYPSCQSQHQIIATVGCNPAPRRSRAHVCAVAFERVWSARLPDRCHSCPG
jgi:hypothetical protein